MLAVQITFKDIANSQSLEAHIKEKAQKTHSILSAYPKL